MARGETRLAVNDERAVRRDDGRIQVEFDELGDLLGDMGHFLDQGRQRPSVVTLQSPTITTDPKTGSRVVIAFAEGTG